MASPASSKPPGADAMATPAPTAQVTVTAQATAAVSATAAAGASASSTNGSPSATTAVATGATTTPKPSVPDQEYLIRRLTVIGVGLIGGSLARALRRARLVEEVVGCGRSLDNLRRAVELGVIDRYSQDPAVAVGGADLVFLAVPLGAMAPTFAAIRDHLAPGAILTDGGSVKGSVVADARQVFGQVPDRFVPGHPIAGTEHSGVEASFAELYRNRRVILTPLSTTDPSAITRVQAMWEACGAEVIQMDVDHHDEVLAATSHLPHLLAYALVDSLARLRENDEIFRYAAGGFRDFTRIASSHPVMWRDICLANRAALGQMLARFQGELAELAVAVERGDGDGLLGVFERAKAARDRYVGRLG